MLQRLPAEAGADGPVPVGAVVALEERGEELSATPVTRAEAVPALVQNLFTGRTEGLRPAYRLAARLGATVPVLRASLPDDLERTSSAAAELVDRLGSARAS